MFYIPLIVAWRVTGAAIHCSRSIFLRARPYAKTAYGRKRISYMDLRKGHGPPKTLTPTSESIYRQCHWICIVRPFFGLMSPESASLRACEPIAGCLRAIARLLHLGRANNGSQNSSSQRQQLELKIASRLSEANSAQMSCLEETSPGVKEIYVACLPWLL